jgi:hypothetical protein
MSAKPSSNRKPTAVEKLSEYDDICTDLLIDKVEFWSQIHKMADHYKSKRKITDRQVLDIVRNVSRGMSTLQEAS